MRRQPGLQSASGLPAVYDEGASDEAKRSEPQKPGLSEQIKGLHTGITLPLYLLSHPQRSSTGCTQCAHTQKQKHSVTRQRQS